MNLQFESKTSQGPQGSDKVDWQTAKLTIRERNAFMFKNSLMSDISFVVKATTTENLGGDVKTMSIPAHKYVLAISSPVFYAMFYGGIAEVHQEISLPDCDSQSLLDFLRYLYSDEIDIIPGNVLGIMYLAKKYMVPSLVHKCATFLAECLDESNVLEIWMQARRFEVEELQQRCLEIIDVYATACLDTDGLFSLDHDAIVSLLQRETLIIDEYCLFKKIVQWAKAKCQQQSSLQEGSDIRKVLGTRVTNLIRFPTMRPEQFAEGVALSGVLKEDEVVDVFLHLSSKDPATAECAFKTAPRIERKMIQCSLNSLYGFKIWGNVFSENIEFKSSTNIFVSGVCLLGFGNSGRVCPAVLQIWDADNKKVVTKTEFAIESQQCGGDEPAAFDIHFEKPAMIKANTKYFIQFSFNCQSTDSEICLYGSNSTSTSWQVTSNGTEFFFKIDSSYGSTNCSTISKLLYFKGKMNFNICNEKL